MKKLWILALLLLTACTPQAPEAWGPEALDFFQLTEADTAGLEEMAQTLDKTIKGEESTLRLSQAVGDGKTLYLFFELTLPQGWGQRLQEEGASLSFESTCCFGGKPQGRFPTTAWNSMQTCWEPQEGDMVTGYVSFDFLEQSTGRELTFLLGELTLEGPPDPAQPEEPPPVWAVCDDLHAISWTSTCRADAVTAAAPPQGVSCVVTPLTLKAQVCVDSPPASGEFPGLVGRFLISITYADGRTASGYSLGTGGDNSAGGASYTLDLRPKAGGLFLPGQVETVAIEDIVFRFAPAG